MTAFTADAMAAINRLATLYNGRSYDVATNPGGFANDGHTHNFEPALRDLAAVGTAVAAEGGAVRTLAVEVQDNADAVAEIAADPGLIAVGLDLVGANTIGAVAAIAGAVTTAAGAIEAIQAAPAAAAAAIQAALDAEIARQGAVNAVGGLRITVDDDAPGPLADKVVGGKVVEVEGVQKLKVGSSGGGGVATSIMFV